MQSFQQLSDRFDVFFNVRHFPAQPSNLYDAAQYIIDLGGKRVRPVALLMSCDLFAPVTDDALHVAAAIEMFHNFSLVHDDIMDKAPLRRGKPTVHALFSEPTALLAGDTMFAQAYDYLTRIDMQHIKKIIQLFNKTSKEVCEGQQMDMDFETADNVTLDDYLKMITLKTSVLLGASMQLGALLGGAGAGNQEQLYAFGKKLGIAFQVQDDYLDTFGDAASFGKQVGGDILANKKTFLLLHALEVASEEQKLALQQAMQTEGQQKINAVKEIYKQCGADAWSNDLKLKYYDEALVHLDKVAVQEVRKGPLKKLAASLLHRNN